MARDPNTLGGTARNQLEGVACIPNTLEGATRGRLAGVARIPNTLEGATRDRLAGAAHTLNTLVDTAHDLSGLEGVAGSTGRPQGIAHNPAVLLFHSFEMDGSPASHLAAFLPDYRALPEVGSCDCAGEG